MTVIKAFISTGWGHFFTASYGVFVQLENVAIPLFLWV
jgi:hypothetical protein